MDKFDARETGAKQVPWAGYWIPRMRDILFLIVFVVALAAGWRTLNSDGDLPRHLLTGRVILETHAVPTHEMFSQVTAGLPYVTHEWLADLIYYLFYLALGLKGVVLLTAVLVAGTFLVLYNALCSQQEERLLTLILVLWGVAVTYQHWIARPHLFSMLFLAIWLALVDRISRGEEVALWILPALMVLWANLHAEFIAGFLVLVAYMAGLGWDAIRSRQAGELSTLKKLAWLIAACLLASLINPFGWRTWSTVFGYLKNSGLMTTISETRAPDFSSPSFLVEFLLILASILILALRTGRIQSGRAFLLTGFTALAMTAGRNIHLYGIVAPFVLAGPLIEIGDSALQRRVSAAIGRVEGQLRGVLFPVATVLAGLILLIAGEIGGAYYFDPRLFPVEAVQWLKAHPQSGQMFNDFKWGGFLVWNLWPAQKDFIDSQTDTTGEATAQYGTVESLSPGWQAVLDRYSIQWAILPRESSLSQELAREGWTTLYQDSTAIIQRRE